MAETSFGDISNHNWQPVSTYQAIQSQIQDEVKQGLWANHARTDGWCCIQVSPVFGAENTWTTHTYQHPSQGKASIVWPAGWPSPAENIHGQLPGHFFSGTTAGGVTPDSHAILAQPLHEVQAAPASQPTYKPAGLCT